MKGAFLLGCAVLHIMQVVAIIILFNDYHFVDPAIYESVKNAESKNVLHVAAQLGRFDLVSMLLAVVTLFLGIIALAGFWMIRGAAVRAAENAAREEIKTNASHYIKEMAETLGRDIFSEANAVQKGISKPHIDIGRDQEKLVIAGASEFKEV